MAQSTPHGRFMDFTELPRFVRTVKHLRGTQVLARGRKLLASKLPSRPIVVPQDVESLCVREGAFLSAGMPEPPDVDAAAFLDSLERGEFFHLGEGRQVGRERPNWFLGEVQENRLWVITLHYHEWLYRLARITQTENEKEARQAFGLLQFYLSDWLEHCDVSCPGARSLACNPFAIATRLGWWLKAFSLVDDLLDDAARGLREQWLRAMWRQAECLYRNVEWDLRANHLLRDAVGLARAGRFFSGKRPAAWLRMATKIAVDQAAEQILPDGGHFERSPFYHLEAMSDFSALASLLRDESAKSVVIEAWQRAAVFAAWMRHPDGGVAGFNDGGVADVNGHLMSVEAGQAFSSTIDMQGAQRGGMHFADTGCVVWHGQLWSVMVDVGEIGPRCQPGHGHADTLAFECSFDGDRLFVDPGTHSYDNDDRRRYDRSTDAHNTVCVDGQNSSEVWHIFRAGRRASPRDVSVEFDSCSSMSVTAGHSGYDHLPGMPRHQRTIDVNQLGELSVIDRVDGQGRHALAGGYLLDPRWSVEQLPSGWCLTKGSQVLCVNVAGPDGLVLETQKRPLHPDYGVEEMTCRLAWRYCGEVPAEVHTVVTRRE